MSTGYWPPWLVGRIKEVQTLDRKTKRALLWTGLYLGVIGSFRGCDALALLWEGKLNELGDFLAGVLTPVFFLWLVVGYFLQRDEFGLQRNELKLQRDELEQARRALGEQVRIQEARANAERLRTMPNLSLRERGLSGQKRDFDFINFGGPARRLEIISGGGYPPLPPKSKGSIDQLDTNETLPFSLPEASVATNPYSHSYTVRFSSERHERFEQRWTITFTCGTPPVEIQEDTEGPMSLAAD